MLKVLIVESRHSERFLAKQLLNNYGMEFTWRCVATQFELRAVTREFAPHVVLYADEMVSTSPRAELDLVRLISPQPPEILICEVTKEAIPPWQHVCDDRPPVQRSEDVVFCTETASAGPRTPVALPSLLDTSTDVVVMTDADGFITYASPRACSLLSASCEDRLMTHVESPGDATSRSPHWFDVTMDSADGGEHHHLRPARDRAVAFFEDAGSTHRPAHVGDLLQRLGRGTAKQSAAIPLVAVNLDGLALMNATYGPGMGDNVLGLIRQVLSTKFERGGVVARIGDDDFLVALPDAPAVESELPSLIGPEVRRFKYDVPGCGEPRLQVESDLGHAIQRQALRVHFQPQFDVASGRGCGVEALARWFRSSGECITPAVFIPVAERVGMIHTLGAWILQNACETAVSWRGRDADRLTLSVNVSTLQINHGYSRVLSDILASSGFPAARLELEIEESALLAHSELTLDCLKQWKRFGVRIAVSHLGTDYSSLGYLSRLSVDRLKLNRALTRNIATDRNAASVVHALIGLGVELGIDVIAEGVETVAQFQMLEDLGCRQAQGFLLGRPMPDIQAQVALRKQWGNYARRPIRTAAATATPNAVAAS